MEIIRTENLSFTYPGATAKSLDSVNLTVNQGDFTVICGPSASGKTTLLKMLKKEMIPYGTFDGQVIIDGKSISEYENTASLIGYVSQNPHTQVVTDKVWHELAFGPENLGVPHDVIRKRMAETCEYFGITPIYRRDTAVLSGGRLQLLNLASALMSRPSILLLDEPTSQLDPVSSANFINTLKRLNSETGVTILITAHSTDDLFPFADRIVFIEGGKLLYNTTPKEAVSIIDSAYLPSASRIFKSAKDCPITVKEGKIFLQKTFNNNIKKLRKPRKPQGDEVVKIKNLYFSYDKKSTELLRGLSLNVHKGDILALMGGNGSGKTTLLSLLNGFYKPLSGRIKCAAKKIAFLPQDVQTVFLHNTLLEDMQSVCSDNERIINLCNSFNITNITHCHPYDLSGGQQQKAALVILLLQNPDLLLLDEPTKGMDPHSRKELGSLLRALAEDGITVICATHDTEFAAEYANHCALLFDGEIISSGYPDEFFSENDYYTTAASKISAGFFENAVTCEDVIELCSLNGEKL